MIWLCSKQMQKAEFHVFLIKSRSRFPENPFIFEPDVTIGHAGEIIAHGAIKAGFGRAPTRAFADFLRVSQVIIEKLFEHSKCSLVGFEHDPVEI